MIPALTEQQERALRLIIDGARQTKIARVLGVSRSRTREIVRRLCEAFGVDAMADLPDAYAACLEGERHDDMPDDGKIRVDGTHSGV
jgi:DNA-binding NarL/FixJ family response regulator